MRVVLRYEEDNDSVLDRMLICENFIERVTRRRYELQVLYNTLKNKWIINICHDS